MQLRVDIADAIIRKTARDRSMIYAARARDSQNLEDEQLVRLQKTLSWQLNDLGLAWADFWDAIARQLRGRHAED